MATLNTDIRYIKGVGEARAKSLAKLGITDLRSLLSYFPPRLRRPPRVQEDRRPHPRRECLCLRRHRGRAQLSRIRKGLDLVKLRAVDETGALELTYFNQSYLKNTFHTGDAYVFFGRAEGTPSRPQMTNPLFEREGAHQITGRIMPIYPLTAGVSQSMLCKAVEQGLAACVDELPDILPEDVRLVYQLCHTRFAYENIHFPTDDEALSAARRRLAFEELFLLALGLKLLRERRTFVAGKQCKKSRPFALFHLSPLFPHRRTAPRHRRYRARPDRSAPDEPPRAGRRRLGQNNGRRRRHLHGREKWSSMRPHGPDRNPCRAALSLARPAFEPLGIPCALLTASTRAVERRALNERLRSGELSLVIGTHALLSPDVQYQNLGLVVTDEQHRFGVDQRAALSAKGDDPHLLVMSATPIPRTLALMIYGDLDVSILNELPPDGRRSTPSPSRRAITSVSTLFCASSSPRAVRPISSAPWSRKTTSSPDERKAVTAYAEMLQKRSSPTFASPPIHGKMKPKDKDAVMRAFAAHEIDVLVSTTVIEVGVDVPNAALMLIENAECFGLSQLHQLRGRVGRGRHKSYCVLVSDNKGEENKQRLKVMSSTSDGFAIAEEDLKLRGPGDFFRLPPARPAVAARRRSLVRLIPSARDAVRRRAAPRRRPRAQKSPAAQSPRRASLRAQRRCHELK